MSKKAKNVNDLKMYFSQGWDLKDETPEYWLIKRNEGKFGTHLLLFFIFGFWTFLIPNIIYFFVSRKTKKIMKEFE